MKTTKIAITCLLVNLCLLIAAQSSPTVAAKPEPTVSASPSGTSTTTKPGTTSGTATPDVNSPSGTTTNSNTAAKKIEFNRDKDLMLVFSGNGKFLRIDGGYDNCDGTKGLKIKVIGNQDFLQEQFKPLIDKYINAYNNIDKESLELVYDFSEDQAETKKNEFATMIFLINRICHFYPNLKQIISDFDLTTIDSLKYDDAFRNLYTLKYTIDDKEVTKDISIDDIILIKDSFECGKEFNYDLRFNKPTALLVNNNLASIYESMPSKTEYLALSRVLQKDTVFEKMATSIQKTIKEMETIKEAGKLKSKCQILKTDLTELSKLSTYSKLRTYFSSKQLWVDRWLWYTEGIPQLNPFKGADFGTADLNSKLSIANQLLAIYKIKKKYYDTVFVRFPLKAGYNFDEKILFRFADTLKLVQKEIVKLEAEITDLTEKISEIKRSKAAWLIEIEKDKLKDLWIYSGSLITNKTRNLNIKNVQRKTYIRHHDADKNYEIINKVNDNYDEDSKIITIIDNETIPVKLSHKITPIKDSSIVSATLIPIFDGLISFSDLFKGTFAKDSLVDQGCLDTAAYKTLARMTYISKNFEFFNTFNIYQTLSDSSLRRTHVFKQTLPDTVLPVSYFKTTKIIEGEKKISSSYRVNKLYRFWPSAGVVYSNASRPEVTIESDNSLKTKYFNGVKLITGLKIHFWKTAIMDPGFIGSCKRTPGFDYRKIYLFGGVNVLSPAKEFFVGGGIDLWSGLSLTGGWHIVNKKQQVLVNSKVESKNYLDMKNGYIGVNIDISLAIKAVQFFTKKELLK